MGISHPIESRIDIKYCSTSSHQLHTTRQISNPSKTCCCLGYTVLVVVTCCCYCRATEARERIHTTPLLFVLSSFIMADARNLFVLLETAAGYTLFEVVAFEEIGSLLESETVTDLTRFGRAVKLKAFHPFETAQEALENANAIAEHSMTETLSNFLEMNLPLEKKKSSKTAPWALGVIDPALATSIQEGLGKEVPCRSDDTVREILRGCRCHLTTFVKGLEGTGQKAQLGLGHAYSRSKVKFNPARSDNMIIQSIALLDQMDKDLNTFAMRIREWYSWHFPELKDLVKDNIIFARTAALIQDRSTLVKDMDPAKLEALVEVTGDDEVAKAIVAAAKTSMGMDCSTVDMINIINFTQRMVKMAEYRKQLSLYLTNKMSIVAPNLSALIGDTVAARLISKVCHECCWTLYASVSLRASPVAY